MTERILVAGDDGFLGSALCAHLAATRPEARLFGLSAFGGGCPHAEHLRVDLLDAEATAAAVAGIVPDVVYQMAGILRSPDLDELYRGNVRLSANLFDALAVHAPAARVVVPGSAAEYGDAPEEAMPLSEDRPARPVSPYGAAKAWQSMLAPLYFARGLHVTVGRVFNVVGAGVPETLSVGAVAAQVAGIAPGERARISVGNLEPLRDFVDLGDVCRAFVLLAERGRGGEVYNVCSGVPVSVGDVFRRMLEIAGVEAELQVDGSRVRPGDIRVSYGSNAKLRAETGWEPRVPLDDSLAAAIESFRGQASSPA